MKATRWVAVILSAAWLCSGQARATLISTDDAVLGLGKITSDTQTTLHWLDLDLTANMSWNAAEAAFGPLGFRHATTAEVRQLFMNAGILNIDTGPNSTDYNAALALQNLITCLAPPGACRSFGWTAKDSGKSELSWIDRDDGAFIVTVIVDSNNFIGPDPSVFDTFAHPARSQWMVRELPLPPTLWLFGAALCLMLGMRRGLG